MPTPSNTPTGVPLSFDAELDKYVRVRLPGRTPGNYYPPHPVVLMLPFHKKMKIMGVPVSRRKLIQHMINHMYVPLKTTSMVLNANL